MTRAVLVAVFALGTTMVAAGSAVADTGRVTYVTAAAAFVDQGSADGLAVGQKLDLLRKKRKVGACEVTSLAAHHAVCATDRAEAGDRFTFPGAPKPAVTAAPARARLPAPAALEEQRALVVATPVAKVRVARVRAAATPVWAVRGEILLRHQAWATLNAPDANFQKPALDAGVRANLGFLPGLQLGAALRLAGDALAPPSTRSRPDEDLELTVWEAGAFLDAPRAPLVAALGRFRPRRAPGAPLIDGALVAGRALEGAMEIGGYAGALPDAVNLALRFDRFVGGIYIAVDAPLAKDIVLLPRARIGFVSTADFQQSRAELETQAQLCFSDFVVVGGGARVGIDGRTLSPTLDSAHASVDHRPLETVLVRGGYRWWSASTFDLDRLGDGSAALPAFNSTHHGDLSARWDVAPWVTLGVVSGVAAVDDPGDVPLEEATRGWVGPEVVLPGALLGGDLALVYLEEIGAFAGRSTYLQSTHRLGDARIIARVSYLETTAVQEPLREGAALVGLDVPLFTWLSAQARGQSLFALPPLDGHARATPIHVVAQAGLSSSF